MQRKLKFQILPANQARLGLLCGPINSTLKQIEDALNIKISNRGSNFKLKGDKINIEAGKVVLENFFLELTPYIPRVPIDAAFILFNFSI